MTPLLQLGGIASLLPCVGALLLLRAIRRDEIRQMRLRSIGHAAAKDAQRVGSQPLRVVAAIGTAIARSGLLSARTLADLERTLLLTGFRGSGGLGLFVGSKLLLLILLPTAVALLRPRLDLSPALGTAVIGAAAIVGLLAPDMIVKRMRASHLRKLERGLPDALDMMVICSEAGLGLEPAVERVAQEIAPAHPAVAEEFRITASELRVVADRRIALQAMGARTGLETLQRLGTTLIQTMQYGTPLSDALRTLSAEMRHEMLTAFEARAARLPVLLTVPMILFILPTVFLIVAGPATLQVLQATK
jgi:tight adherence protein C